VGRETFVDVAIGREDVVEEVIAEGITVLTRRVNEPTIAARTSLTTKTTQR
jgi:hypothetical protein